MANTDQTHHAKSHDETQSQRNSFRELLVVDDHLIREKYFAEANDILKQIESLELKIKVFHSSDQRLYDQWYKKTFQQDQKAVDQTQDELKDIARFHNWIVATAHQLDIEMQEAYALMKDEQRRYLNGTVEQRKQIERERGERDAFVDSEVHRKYNEQASYSHDDEDTERDQRNPLDRILTHLEDLILKEDREPIKDIDLRIERIMALSDDEIEYHLRSQEIAFLLFDVSLSWGESERDFTFFMRIWGLMSQEQKSTFSEVYGALTGQSIEDLVSREKRKRASSDSDDEDEETEEEDDEAFTFNNSHSYRRPNRAERRAKVKPEEEEKLKGLYRKLIRKLHPDAQVGFVGSQTGWVKRAWELVQKAYNSHDVKALDRLLKLTLLRMHSLDQLTIDEIQEARTWLKKDLNTVEKEASQLKISPAWGFSSRKNYAPLIQKVRKQFQQTVYSIQTQIEELKEQHQMFERLLELELEAGIRRESRPKKKSGNTSSGRRRRSSKRTDWDDEDQESFRF